MTINFRMTVADYKAYCMGFFEQFDKEKLGAKIAAFSIPEFQNWMQEFGEKYNEYYEPVKELLAQIRGDFDPTADYDDERDDPLYMEENHAAFVEFRDTHNDVYQEYLSTLPEYMKKLDDLQAFFDAQELERLLNIEVEGRAFRALKVIPVYWTGWESDQYVWVVQDGDQKRIVATNHGDTYFADKEFLLGKIEEYKKAMADTEDVLAML